MNISMLAEMMGSMGKVSIQHVGPCGFEGPEGPENLGMKGCFVLHGPASASQPSRETRQQWREMGIILGDLPGALLREINQFKRHPLCI